MAGGDAPNLKPVSAKEMYQYAAKAFRENLYQPRERVAAALRATGRAFSEGRFASMAALAAYNEQRHAEAFYALDNLRLPTEFYRESLSFGSAAYRYGVNAEVSAAAAGGSRQVSWTLTSDFNLSPAEWFALADESAERYRQRYGYQVIGLTLTDPRRRTIYSTQGV